MTKSSMKRIHSVTIKHIDDPDPDTSYLGEYGNRATSEFSIDRQHALDCVVNTGVDLNTLCSLCEAPQSKHSDNSLACPSPEVGEDWIDDQSFEPIECSECRECRDLWNRNEFRYFNPGSIEPFDAQATWIPKDIADKKAHWLKTMKENAKQDYARMESYNACNWAYIGIQAIADIQLTQHGPLQEITSRALWGIESDSGRDYLADVAKEELADLSTQLQALGFSKRAIASAFKNVTEVSE